MLSSPAMLCRLNALLATIALAVLACVTINCGSSSSGGGQQGPFNVVGNWQVSFSSVVGASSSGLGVIDKAGVATFFDNGGNIFQLPTISGASSFSGNLNAYAVNSSPFSGGVYSITDSAQGTVTSASTVNGTFTTSASSGTFALTQASPLSGGLTTPSGAYNAKVLGFSDVVSFNFGSNGTFTGSDNPNSQVPGCGFTGAITQQGANNVFDISYTAAATNSCAGYTDTGVAFQSSTDYFNVNNGADASYFYVIVLTSTAQNVRPYVIVIYQ